MCIKKQLRLVENSFANFITDLFKEAMKADIGFISGGSTFICIESLCSIGSYLKDA